MKRHAGPLRQLLLKKPSDAVLIAYLRKLLVTKGQPAADQVRSRLRGPLPWNIKGVDFSGSVITQALQAEGYGIERSAAAADTNAA